MGFQLSPGVKTAEIDLSTVVTGVATTGGVIAGPFQWGPAYERTLVDSELTLLDRFGKPDNDTANTWFTAASFLAYGNNLNVVRCLSSAARNAAAKGDSVTRITITNAGVGYISAPTLTITGGAGSGATATCTVADGKIQTVTITAGGSGFTSAPTVTVTPAGGDTPTTPAVLTAQQGIVIKNITDYENQFAAGQAAAGEWAARFAGDLGNSLTVSVADSGKFATWAHKALFDSAPGTSDYAAAFGGSNDECHVVVIDKNGAWTGVAGDVIERFSFLSKAADAKNEVGDSLYYATIVSRKSKYVLWLDHPTEWTNAGTNAAGTTFAVFATDDDTTYDLSGGVDGNATLTDGQIITGYDEFNVEEFDFALIMTAAHGGTVVTHCIDNIAETRQDCVVFLSPPKAAVVNNPGKEHTDCITYRETFTSSSYAFMDCQWIKKYDKYNDVYRWVPANGDVAGLCVRTDETRDPWFSPAGLNRGNIKGVRGLAWNPKEAYRDVLYQSGINPIVAFPGQGAVLFGDKTLQSKPSAFDRINVRRLFIVLRKAIARAAKYILFEFNDEVTRAQFRALIDPFLRDVQGRRGVYAYHIVCDKTNNTPQVIDTNGFNGDIYVQPARSINFIKLNFIATRTGVSFAEIVGKF